MIDYEDALQMEKEGKFRLHRQDADGNWRPITRNGKIIKFKTTEDAEKVRKNMRMRIFNTRIVDISLGRRVR